PGADPMSEEKAMLSAYAANPDEAHRLILADWFEEHGDPRGAWLRDPDLASGDAKARCAALEALGEVGESAAQVVPAVLDRLRDGQETGNPLRAGVRRTAGRAPGVGVRPGAGGDRGAGGGGRLDPTRAAAASSPCSSRKSA